MPSACVAGAEVGKNSPLLLISGPCVIESEEHTLRCAEQLVRIAEGRSLTLVFKASYDKANRSSLESYRGPGLDEGLRILDKVRCEIGVPLVSDVHTVEEAKAAGEVLDLIQIPAFLCRQTDLLVAAAAASRAVMVKKGQFMAPWDMGNVVQKVRRSGGTNLLLCDRGTSFGYNNLVSDMRAIPIMQELGAPVVYDGSHSVQLPGGLGNASGGERRHIPQLVRAAVAAGADGVFLESHPSPEAALCDAASVYPLNELPALLDSLLQIREVLFCREVANCR